MIIQFRLRWTFRNTVRLSPFALSLSKGEWA